MAQQNRTSPRIVWLLLALLALLVAVGITAYLWREQSREAADEKPDLAERAPGSAEDRARVAPDARVAGTIQPGMPGAPGMAGAPGAQGAPTGPDGLPLAGGALSGTQPLAPDAAGAPGAGAAAGVEAPPAPRFPIESVRVSEAPPAIDLPPIEQSDPVIADSVTTVLSASAFAEFFYLDNIARRFVVTVDNLPRETLAMRLRSAKPIPERFATRGKGEVVELDTTNYPRYERFVRFMLGVDTRVLIALYVRFYPMLQQEYRNLGYPQGYFNDRLVEAIDDLLSAPPIGAPVALVQPKVMYKYEDPDLERLSAGQKVMIRIGPENAEQLKAKLRAIRREVTGGG